MEPIPGHDPGSQRYTGRAAEIGAAGSGENWSRITGIVFVVLIVGLLLVWTSFRRQAEPSSTLSLLPPPQSMEQLVKPANVIVVGTVGQIVRQGTFAGYDPAGVTRNERPGDPVSSRLPITDFEIKVERVLLDDGIVQSGKPLILRMIGYPTAAPADAQSQFPMSRPGDRNLFVLSRTPDNQAYGLYYGPWSRLIINGPTVTYSDGPRTPVGFTNRRSPPAFVADLSATVARMNANR